MRLIEFCAASDPLLQIDLYNESNRLPCIVFIEDSPFEILIQLRHDLDFGVGTENPNDGVCDAADHLHALNISDVERFADCFRR